MPNAFASLMLMTWPLVCLVLLRRMPLERGLIWCLLGGYLLLPPVANFDLPLVPAMDKDSIPTLSAVLILVLVLRKPLSPLPDNTTARVLVLIFLFSVIPTVITNGDPTAYYPADTSAALRDTGVRLPGMSVHDMLAVTVDQAIKLLPFLLGRQFLGSDKGLHELILAMMIGGLIYSIPALIEVRLSPQLNIWIYGFFQHNFDQMMREGGFRPLVFLPHALWLALFMVTALLSTGALARHAADRDKARLLIATVYLAGVLFLCKSLASQLYAIVFLPLVLVTGARTQLRIAALLALIAIIYPVLRNAGLIPLEAILEQAAAIDPDRANSLAYRVNNEQLLLQRAHDKPWFGWGGWGRNLMIDPVTGGTLTIPDGRWIILFGIYGWFGYVAEMGLLALPLLLLWWHTRRGRPSRFSPYTTTVAVVLAVTMIDMLLNDTLIPLTWLCAGALLGYTERLTQPARVPLQDRATAEGPRPLFGKGPAIGGRGGPKPPKTVL